MTGDAVQGSFSLFLTLLHGSASAAVCEGYPGLLHDLGCARVPVLMEPLSQQLTVGLVVPTALASTVQLKTYTAEQIAYLLDGQKTSTKDMPKGVEYGFNKNLDEHWANVSRLPFIMTIKNPNDKIPQRSQMSH